MIKKLFLLFNFCHVQNKSGVTPKRIGINKMQPHRSN